MQNEKESRTESERLFEEYLQTNELTDWKYEPCLCGQPKKPDYVLCWQGKQVLFEVKELRRKAPAGQWTAASLCASLRSEIQEARKKFKRLKNHCCCLVVHNVDDQTAWLDPEGVFSAMLGDSGITWTVGVQDAKLVHGPVCNTFLDGGKMIRPHTDEPQNTTISCIIVLRRYIVRDVEHWRRVSKEIRARKEVLGRSLDLVERHEIDSRLRRDYSPHEPQVPRVIVVENPFAHHPFPSDLFRSAFDERWCISRHLQRVFVGSRLAEIEGLESEL